MMHKRILPSRRLWLVAVSCFVFYLSRSVAQTIPIIDLQLLLNDTSQCGEVCEEMPHAVLQELQKACEEFGLFYVKYPGIDHKYAQKQFKNAKDFFDLPESVKSSIPIKSGGFTRGYVEMGGESGTADRFEVKEAFSYGYPWPANITPSNPLQGPNIWPSDGILPAEWKEGMMELFDKIVAVSEATTSALSLALNGEQDLSEHCKEGDTISFMRLFHYFPYANLNIDGNIEKIGSSPHTDWGFLTVILQDSVGGLQFQYDEQWIDVPHVPDTLVVNCGDYLSLMTNGRFKSPLHRVVSSEHSAERYSFVFFYYPSYEAKFAVESNLQDESKNRLDRSYNTLLDMSTDVDISQTSFGDYLLGKWNRVYRK